jgi:hypothetical protein
MNRIIVALPESILALHANLFGLKRLPLEHLHRRAQRSMLEAPWKRTDQRRYVDLRVFDSSLKQRRGPRALIIDRTWLGIQGPEMGE